MNEDYLDAQVRLRKLSSRVEISGAAAQQAEVELRDLRRRIRTQALATYANPPASQGDALRTSENINEFERRGAYAKRGANANFDAEDALRSAVATLNERQSAASRAKTAVANEAATLKSKQKKAAELLKDYEALEARARGDLAVLVRAAEKAAAEREAKQAMAAQRRRQQEARAELERRRTATRQRLGEGTEAGVGASGKGKIASTVIARKGTRLSDAQLAIEAGETREVPASPGAGSAVTLALAQVGKPYVWAADGPESFDCSGLMLFAWRAGGASLPHSSRSQFATTTRVSVSQIRPGDLVFYGRPIHHVGMYVGNGQMVEASRSGRPVKISSIFRRDMVGVGRIR